MITFVSLLIGEMIACYVLSFILRISFQDESDVLMDKNSII